MCIFVQTVKTMREYKIVVLGSGGVGKLSILHPDLMKVSRTCVKRPSFTFFFHRKIRSNSTVCTGKVERKKISQRNVFVTIILILGYIC